MPIGTLGKIRSGARKHGVRVMTRTRVFSILGLSFCLVALSACHKKEDAPGPSVPHVAGNWVGTGTDDAIGYFNISMDLTQSDRSAAGTFTMSGTVATVTGNVTMNVGAQGGSNLTGLVLTRVHWTLNDPTNANRLCAGELTALPSSMTSGAVNFHYSMSDCQTGTWNGGANLTKQAGTN